MPSDAHPSDFLHDVLRARQRHNSAYSLRAFARDLGVSHSYLSLVLGGKRRLPETRALEFAQSLRLPPAKAKSFVAASRRQPSTQKRPKSRIDFKFLALDLDRFRTIGEWYHVAILDLVHLKGFQSSTTWIAKTLGVPRKKTDEAIRRLFRLGLLEIGPDGNWRKTHSALSVPVHRPSEAIRRYHGQMIEKAKTALKAESQYSRRDVTASTIPVNPDRLPEAKKRIAKFRKQLMAFLSEGDCTDLYQLNVQLFALTGEK